MDMVHIFCVSLLEINNEILKKLEGVLPSSFFAEI